MMKYIFLLLVTLLQLDASMIEAPILSVDAKEQSATIALNAIDKGMSGFVLHHISQNHSLVLKSVVVKSVDAKSGTATLRLLPFHLLDNSYLPQGKYSVSIGDRVYFAFGYNRALLIAPSEEIYHRIEKGVESEWVHPDLFATMLSVEGHPSPMKSDFERIANSASIGLLFVYLDGHLYMLDMKSFTILKISDTPFVAKRHKRPFYTRVEKIDSSWWDWSKAGKQIKAYRPYYYKLLLQYNPNNSELEKYYKQFEQGSKK